MSNTLEVKNLKTYFFTRRGIAKAVDDVSFSVRPGEIVAIVGESGCGKSVTMRSIMRIIRYPGRIVGGEILFNGTDLLRLPEKKMRRIRGGSISLIIQEPTLAFDPCYTVGYQTIEAIREHGTLSRAEANAKTVKLLESMNIPDPARQARSYPHELSGGMLQRAMIAISLSSDPKLVIADEPTTSLDVTTQAQVLELMVERVKDFGTSLILVTHNLGLVARYAHRIFVMYAGRFVETGTTEDLYTNPKHSYTQGLWASIPRLDQAAETDKLKPLEGMPPSLFNLGQGCQFEPRCWEKSAGCDCRTPPLHHIRGEHYVACHRYGS